MYYLIELVLDIQIHREYCIRNMKLKQLEKHKTAYAVYKKKTVWENVKYMLHIKIPYVVYGTKKIHTTNMIDMILDIL